MNATQVISQQIAAYNNRDLEGNMTLFSDSFKMINFSDGAILLDGKEACREMYTNLFANSPDLFAEVINRIDYDNKVILHEYIFGKNGSKEKLGQLLLFEVHQGKIERITRF